MRTLQQRTQAPEFFNHWSMAAILLFALNNWYFKSIFSNWFTGKLSDFLACFILPLFVSSCILLILDKPVRVRLILGCMITLIVFSSVKISSNASDWLNTALSYLSTGLGWSESINISDPSDLIALPMIGIAYLFGMNRARMN